MTTLSGIGVSPGSAHGPVVRISHDPIVPPADEPAPADPSAAAEEVVGALSAVGDSLRARAEAVDSADARGVLEATAMIAGDPDLAEQVRSRLADGAGPVTALHDAIEFYCDMLEGLGGYMAERVTDLRDVFQRAAARLLGRPEPGIPELTGPSVLVAHDLAPADTAALDVALVRGIVTEAGGPTSHTAILAAQLGIPAVVKCVGILAAQAEVIGLDGGSGVVHLDPGADEIAELERRQARRLEVQAAASGPGRTKDGTSVKILANIGTLDDALKAAQVDVEGVGLFRTEFLFLDRATAPTRAEQTETYRRVFEAFGARRVVVRTLDAGADKPLPFADLGAEENPALGVRGLRLQRERLDLLDDQLGAIADAASGAEADVWVMAPMVATAEEARWFTERARAVGLRSVGVMVEVPAAALRARHVFDTCDFASIGTNDLSQYTFAADRMDGRLATLLSGWQPGLWELIALTVEGGREHDAPVGICGEVGGDPLLALVAAGVGVTSLSMATGKVGLVKAALALHDIDTCRELAALVLSASGPDEAREAVLARVDPALTALL